MAQHIDNPSNAGHCNIAGCRLPRVAQRKINLRFILGEVRNAWVLHAVCSGITYAMRDDECVDTLYGFAGYGWHSMRGSLTSSNVLAPLRYSKRHRPVGDHRCSSM